MLPQIFDSEQGAIQKAQDGDREAFSYLYTQHKRRIYGLCFRMTHNRDIAEELTQDTFLQVFRKIKTFRGQSAFSTWLHRVAVNVVLMELRHGRSKPEEVPLDDETSNNGDQDFPSNMKRLGRTDPVLVASAERVSLEHAIADLPSGYALVFLLHDVYGYHHSEIAALLGCSVGNTKSQLHKARLKLRRKVLGQPSSRRNHRRRDLVLAFAQHCGSA